MNFKDQETEEKLRGGYYTPFPIAYALTQWALSGGARSVLEPSCGDGVFLRAIEQVLSSEDISGGLSIEGVELLPGEAAKAREVADILRTRGIEISIRQADFAAWIVRQPRSAVWDAVVGNPPYIRYQYLEPEQQERFAQIFKMAGVPYSKRTGSWVPFVIASVMHLSPGGRLAMVLPTEILHVIHADPLRRILEQEMKWVDIQDVRELVFEDALQGIVLLRGIKNGYLFRPLSDSYDGGAQLVLPFKQRETAKISIQALTDVDDLQESLNEPVKSSGMHQSLNGRWTRALLDSEQLTLLRKIEGLPWAEPFAKIANVDIGIVTGANRFFVVDVETAQRYELTDIASPMLARSNFIEGITYTSEDQKRNEQDGKRVLFLEFPDAPKNELPPRMQEYLSQGEEQGLTRRYKCRIRDRWYVVPYIWTSELSLLKRSHHYPRLVLNEARAYSTDTAYRITMRQGFRGKERNFVFSFLNSLTLLCAELEGRQYGGGVLELVPSEIERLLIPLVPVTNEQFKKADLLVRRGASVDELLDFTDQVILGPGTRADLSKEEIITLRTAYNLLHDRRLRN